MKDEMKKIKDKGQKGIEKDDICKDVNDKR